MMPRYVRGALVNNQPTKPVKPEYALSISAVDHSPTPKSNGIVHQSEGCNSCPMTAVIKIATPRVSAPRSGVFFQIRNRGSARAASSAPIPSVSRQAGVSTLDCQAFRPDNKMPEQNT